ncbi:MAG: helix-turn-helix transcriptional regulator [Leptospirales bacterium]|nr:helix-turn-helix transcriptional regulator [Leptospirales bacterium]
MGKTVASDLDTLEAEVRTALTAAPESLLQVSLTTGISKTHLTNFKNGKRNLSFQNLDQLARHLGVRYSLRNF